jgi:hypothetical protein
LEFGAWNLEFYFFNIEPRSLSRYALCRKPQTFLEMIDTWRGFC